jgi:magnesium transporter
VIDRCADILERAGADVDAVSSQIFEPSPRKAMPQLFADSADDRQKGGLTQVRESLVSIGRLISL